MKTTFLDFEQPIAELENRIEELRYVQDDSALDISEEIERLAVEKASATTIEHVAREQGMKTLREDGLSKVLAGVTSLDEILRVVV